VIVVVVVRVVVMVVGLPDVNAELVVEVFGLLVVLVLVVVVPL